MVEVENLYLDLYLSLIPLVEHAGSDQQEVGVRVKKTAVKVRPAEHMGGWNVEVMVVDPKLYVSSCL